MAKFSEGDTVKILRRGHEGVGEVQHVNSDGTYSVITDSGPILGLHEDELEAVKHEKHEKHEKKAR